MLINICQKRPKRYFAYFSVHGGWSIWSMWSACPMSCNPSTQNRSRTCTAPAPMFGGLNCTTTGPDLEYQNCSNIGNLSCTSELIDYYGSLNCNRFTGQVFHLGNRYKQGFQLFFCPILCWYYILRQMTSLGIVTEGSCPAKYYDPLRSK